MKKISFTALLMAAGFAAPAIAVPTQWTEESGGNGHYYDFIWNVTGPISWTEAQSAAGAMEYMGMTGYLATITGSAEQSFLDGLNRDFVQSSPVHGGEFVTAWLGGTDRAEEGDFTWLTGEEFAFMNFAPHEPNNDDYADADGQDFVRGWYVGNGWDDCQDNCDVHKYVVEYGDTMPDVAPVPLPASLPLVLAGLGALGWAGRRKA